MLKIHASDKSWQLHTIETINNTNNYGNAYLSTRTRHRILPVKKENYRNFYFASNKKHINCVRHQHIIQYMPYSIPNCFCAEYLYDFYDKMSNLCIFRLVLSLFVPGLGGEMHVSTFFYQSYLYCWWLLLRSLRKNKLISIGGNANANISGGQFWQQRFHQ